MPSLRAAAVAFIGSASTFHVPPPILWSSRRTSSIRLAFEPLDQFEERATAGIWSLSLDLDDGMLSLVCNLNADGSLSTDTKNARSKGWERWEASADAETNDLKMRVRLGPWMLRGLGGRCDGTLRCRSIKGSVLEGGDDPVCVGSFDMSLRVPVADDDELDELERSHRAKVDARPAPPPRFRRGHFCGGWKLLIAFDETTVPSVFTVALAEDFKFASPSGEEDGAVLGGSWGVWDKTRVGQKPETRPSLDTLGTHFWIQVERERSTSTLRGLANLPVHESFSLWGKPTLRSKESELLARTPAGGSSDAITGYCYFGTSADREYFTCGRFQLARDTADADETSVERQ